MVLWFGELRFCWKTSAENFEKLRRRTTVFTSTEIQLRTLNFAFCHFTAMDAWTSNWLIFCSLQLQTGCHFWQMWWTCTSCFFLPLVFTGSPEGKLHQCHFLSTKGLRTLLGSHSSREKTCSWSYFESSGTWGPSETTSILYCEILSSDSQSWRTDPEHRTSTW